MRKKSTYRPRRVSAPMMICKGAIDNSDEMRERMIVEAFSGGWATTDHYDNIAEMRNLLMIGAAHKDDQPLLSFCHAMSIVLSNIRIRYSETNKIGVSGDELAMLREFCEIYADFWKRQTMRLYERSFDELQVLIGRPT